MTRSDAAQVLAVDFADRTGAFRGGATGTLYGFGDEGVPTRALVNGARLTNSSQKVPDGAQHPSGDALRIEGDFFAKHGRDLYVYIQDHYPDWPYHGGERPEDFAAVVETVVEAVAVGSARPRDYVFIPFNEADGNWYQDWETQKDQFLADWQAAYEKIQEVWARHGLGHARIGGPGDCRWQPERSADLLAFAKANGSLPDVFIWHELGIENLAHYRANYKAYRELEASLGISPRTVNITEYGMLRDMGVPGQLVQWFTMFEETKADAQTAYWNYAGNFSDNSARPNGANAGWWMFKWYGDLAGSETAAVTPPEPDGVDTLQGIGAIDEANRRAHVIWGGTDDGVELRLSGLDAAVFGERVDVEVREITLAGAEGLAGTPRVVHAADGLGLEGGALRIAVPSYDRYAAYQLIVTPEQARGVAAGAAEQPWTAAIEAENMRLTAAEVRTQDPKAKDGWQFLASGGRDVHSFNRIDSSAEWTVAVPHDGAYRLQVIGASPGVPGRHALFVDGEAAGIVQYGADLALNDNSRWQYRGSAEVIVELKAGTRTLTIRASADGKTLLPNAEITLDKVSLTSVEEGEPVLYPASGFRLFGGAALDWAAGPGRGSAAIPAGGRADLYVTAMESGYYDLELDWGSETATAIELAVNGRPTATVGADAAGAWRSRATVHLAEGINEIEIASPAGASVRSLRTVRARAADAAAVVVRPEAMTLHGQTAIGDFDEGTGTNASGSAYVVFLGNGADNTVELPRTGFAAPGEYDLTVYYANAELDGHHDYNPQVVDRRLDIREGTEPIGHAHCRYTYAWTSFSQRTIPISLSTPDEPVRLGNPDAWAPDLDRVVIAPRLLGEPTTAAR